MENIKQINQEQWQAFRENLMEKGYALLPTSLSEETCESFQKLYGETSLYRKVIDMKRYRFGSGEYKYFAYPLPERLQVLRELLYQEIQPVANTWMERMNLPQRYPENLGSFLEKCSVGNQVRPTPLILKYEEGDYNCLHQDMYGEIYFPFQAVLFLSQPGKDYHGGEFVMTEQIPRAQSKAIVLAPNQGQILVFSTQYQPMKGIKGYYKANMKHGVSEILKGIRMTLGIIFHDAL